MVLLTVASIAGLGWKLDLNLGRVMFVGYALFLTQALLTETGVIRFPG